MTASDPGHPLARRHGSAKLWSLTLLGAVLVTLALISRGDAFLGTLTQLADPDGCIVDEPSGDLAGCTNTGKALQLLLGPNVMAVSPDGKHVYVASKLSDAVAAFRRDKTTGALTQLADPDGCIVNEPSPDITGCANTGTALDAPEAVAVSPDGKHVYVASGDSDAVAIFKRDKTTGALTQLANPDGCIVDAPAPIAGCTSTGKALNAPQVVAVSPDGKHVYVASLDSDAVAIFRRDKATGALTQLADPDGCIVDASAPIAGCTTGKALVNPISVAVSRDGKHAYVASVVANAIAVFRRDKTTGALTQLADPDGCIVNAPSADIGGCTNTGKALSAPFSVAVSKDGKNAYVGTFTDAVAVFKRDKATGALTQLADPDGCIVNEPSPDIAGCTNTGAALDQAVSVAVSKDGKNVYVASQTSDAIAIFARDPKTGQLVQLESGAACMSADGTACKALNNVFSVAVSPDGKHIYAASQDPSNAVAIFARGK